MKNPERVNTVQIKRSLNIYSRQLKSSDNFRIHFVEQNPVPLNNFQIMKKSIHKRVNGNLQASKKMIQQEKKSEITVEDYFNKVQIFKQKQEEIKIKRQSQNNFYHKLYRTLREKLKKNTNHATQEAKQQIKLMQKCRNNKHMRKNSMSCSLEKYFPGSKNQSHAGDFQKMRVLRKKKSQTMKNCCKQMHQNLGSSISFQVLGNKNIIYDECRTARLYKEQQDKKKNKDYFCSLRPRKNDTRILKHRYQESQKQFRVRVNELMKQCQKQNKPDTDFRKNLDTFNFFCKKVDKRLEDVGNIFIKKCINL